MKYILLTLLMISPLLFAKGKAVKKSSRGPASAEMGNVDDFKPTMVVTDEDKKLGDDPEAEGASWHFMQPAEHSASMAVGQLFAGDEPRCSATVIVPPNCPDPAKAKPQVVSNGHCTLKAMDGFKMQFNGFEGVPKDKRPEISMQKVYATENGTDIGVFELDTTVDQLGKFGVKPVKLAASMGDGSYANLTMPLQGVTDPNRNIRMNGNCVRDTKVTVIDQYRFYPGAYAFKNCSAVGGASGSGLFNSSGELAGVMFAGALSEAAKAPQHVCQLDTCVYDGEGVPTRKESNFGLDVTSLNLCYENCKLNFKKAGCPLPDPASTFGTIVTSSDPVWTSTLDHSIQFTHKEFSKLHVKMCMDAKTCNCHEEAGYVDGPKGTLSNGRYGYGVNPSKYMPEGAKIKAAKGDPATFQFLCMRGERPDGSLDDLKSATSYPQWLYNKGSIFDKLLK